MENKKAVITMLGLVGHQKLDSIIENNEIKKIFIDKEESDKAIYTFSQNLKNDFFAPKERYINTLPLIIDTFKNDYIINTLGTQKSIDTQLKVLNFEGYSQDLIINTSIKDDKNYDEIFKTIDDILGSYENVIIDITHGFRHLPILAIINLIIQNIKDIDKIKHILFAKENKPNQDYEIIDLIDYIELANLSYVLVSFNKNYTVGSQLAFKNENYQELVENLSDFSRHILANSIKYLTNDDDSLIKNILLEIDKLKDSDSKISTFSKYLNDIKTHLNEILNLSKEKDYKTLVGFSKIMLTRDYLLNSITFLNEAVGMLSKEYICSLDDVFKEHIENYEKNIEKYRKI